MEKAHMAFGWNNKLESKCREFRAFKDVSGQAGCMISFSLY